MPTQSSTSGHGVREKRLLEDLYDKAKTIKTGTFYTTVNEFTDQLPALRPAVLQEVTERLVLLRSVEADKILVEEDKGAIIGSAVCLAIGLPLAVARWYTYTIDDAIDVPIESEYFSGNLYVNGIEAGDRVVIVDDTISTGGTLAALINAIRKAGADVVEILVAVEKIDNGGVKRIQTEFGIPVRTLIKISVDPATERVRVLPTVNLKPALASAGGVGNTELTLLKHVAPPDAAAIFAKCEFKNPTGSHKDRVYSHMLAELEARAEIFPGMTLIDCSTGNGGAALAQVGAARGYQVVILMPIGMTAERKSQIRSFGAEIIETPAEGFLIAAEEMARSLVQERPGSYFLDQSTNLLNQAAWRSCGHEIAAELRRLGKRPDAFICSIGTGGTFSGIAEILKTEFPDLLTVAVEVDKSAPLHAKREGREFIHQTHNLMGLGPGKIARNLREDLIDYVELVSGEDAWQMMKRLIGAENLFVGPTAGANVLVSTRWAQRLGPDKTIVTVLFDSAWKYFSVWDGHYADY